MLKTIICLPIPKNNLELAIPVKESLGNASINVYENSDVSFSKVINTLIQISDDTNNDVLIVCSHRVRPTENDVKRLLDYINKGFGLVCFYGLAFFGFKIELIKRIGFFDERFIPAGYEDNDFYIRLKESDIAMYSDKSVKYIAGPSLWSQELYEFPSIKFKQPITFNFFIKKWKYENGTYYRKLPEVSLFYKLKESDPNIKFLDYSHSISQDIIKNVKVELEIIKKRILIFGGSGSLGKKLIEKYNNKNDLYIFSRDENKHWEIRNSYPDSKLNFIIGDVRNIERVEDIIRSINPHIIIIASAMKHIDLCEYNTNEALLTNTIGVLNICKSVKRINITTTSLESVIFISTDKACSPCNVYGMTKSLSEKIIIEYSLKMNLSKVKFINCRYGNVLNSRGSIIPKLIENKDKELYLTHPDMTRFIMTQDQAVSLIEYAILNGVSGDTIIPKLFSMKINDLFEIFAEKSIPNKKIVITKIRTGEKIHEDLISEIEWKHTISKDDYYIINNFEHEYKKCETQQSNYSSSNNIISKFKLKEYLSELKLI